MFVNVHPCDTSRLTDVYYPLPLEILHNFPYSMSSMQKLEFAVALAIHTYCASLRHISPRFPMALCNVQQYQLYPIDIRLKGTFCTKFLFANTSMRATSPVLPRRDFHVPFVSIVVLHCFINRHHSIMQFGVNIFFLYVSNSQRCISSSVPHYNCANSVRIMYTVPDVSSLLK
jgi:hypothetical protein